MLTVQNTIQINASLSRVWDVLVKPEETKKYMFGCETVSDWNIGSELLWRGEYEGQQMVFVKGFIKVLEPGKKLVYTVIDPNSDMEDIPANYLNVTYELKEENGQTIFTVTQDGFEGAADGEKRYKDTYNNGEGWNPILVEIKKVAELQ